MGENPAETPPPSSTLHRDKHVVEFINPGSFFTVSRPDKTPIVLDHQETVQTLCTEGINMSNAALGL